MVLKKAFILKEEWLQNSISISQISHKITLKNKKIKLIGLFQEKSKIKSLSEAKLSIITFFKYDNVTQI